MSVHPPTDPEYLESMPKPARCWLCGGTGRGGRMVSATSPCGGTWRFWSPCYRCSGEGIERPERPMGCEETGE